MQKQIITTRREVNNQAQERVNAQQYEGQRYYKQAPNARYKTQGFTCSRECAPVSLLLRRMGAHVAEIRAMKSENKQQQRSPNHACVHNYMYKLQIKCKNQIKRALQSRRNAIRSEIRNAQSRVRIRKL